MNAELTQFVRDALSRGMPRAQVREALIAARWRPDEVDAALAAWADGVPGLPIPRRRVSLSAREAFQHLVLFATLYIFTFDVGAVLFVLVDRRIHDAAGAGPEAGLTVLRWAVSGALTALPIFLWMHHMVEREMAREAEKRSSGVRRWLTYLTLFVTALVLIGNFATLVSNVLAGELSLRFVLKSLVVFAIAGTVFGHFLQGLRREELESDARARVSWLGRAGIAAAAIAIVAGLFAGGAPKVARQRQLDWQRLNALMTIESQVGAYFSARHVLPDSLEQMVRAGIDVPQLRDPETGRRYGYERVDSLTFRLDAVFVTADTLGPAGESVPRSWRHGAGRQAFVRQVPLSPLSPPMPRGVR